MATQMNIEHPHAEAIYLRVRKQHPHISLATIHRTLETLCEIGEARKVTLLHDSARYDGNVMPHHHVVCIKTPTQILTEVDGVVVATTNAAVGSISSTTTVDIGAHPGSDWYKGELDEVYARLHHAGGDVIEQGETNCCYAKSEKSWIDDPAGISWETFLTSGESIDYGDGSGEREARIARAACCGTAPDSSAASDQTASCCSA